MASKVLFRAEGGKKAGMGHLMRCKALGEALRELGASPLLMTNASALEPPVRESLAEVLELMDSALVPGSAEDKRATREAAAGLSADWVVLDGYWLDSVYLEGGFQRKLAVIDDGGSLPRYPVDLVVNPNVYGDGIRYEGAGAVLGGPRYALLRGEFRRRAPAVPGGDGSRIRSVLLSLGGSDCGDHLEPVLQALLPWAERNGAVLHCLAGPQSRARPRTDTEHLRWIASSGDMPGLLASVDVAVLAAGVTASECAFLGVPMILLVTAENQRPVASAFAERGAAVSLGEAGALRAEAAWAALDGLQALPERRKLAERSLLDGAGALRVAARMLGAELFLRPARAADSRLIFEWANDPAVRSTSFSPEPILWENHEPWYKERLSSGSSRFFIAESAGGEAVGQLRVDLSGRQGTVTVSVDPAQRGKGRGRKMLALLAALPRPDLPCETLAAYVLKDNVGSARAFEAAGYALAGLESRNGKEAYRYERARIG